MNHRPLAAQPRPSACPGLLRIVAARDGGICRIKLPGGRLSTPQARAIAVAAEFCGGVLEATNRANLQIRGIRAGCEPELIERLLAAGLGSSSAGGDDVRNLMLSPSAGHDPQALLDTRPLAAELLARLEGESRWHVLSPKFAIQLDGGEALAMLEHPHDLWLSALPGEDGLRYAFGLAGCPPQRAEDAPALASIPAGQAGELVFALLALFLEWATAEQTRMRHLLAMLPAPAVLDLLRERHPTLELHNDAALAAWRRVPAAPQRRFAVQAQREAGLCQVGAQSVLGRLRAGQLWQLAELAERHGDASLRLTPWQGVLLPNVAAAEADGVLRGLQRIGLLTDPVAPLARLIACTGSSGCARALADTKADALDLAERLPHLAGAADIHLSGCPRSCAAAHTAAFTLLAREPGRYQLSERIPGSDGFGRVLADSLTIEQAADWLASPHPSPEHP